jgi:hypothetical protein
MMTKEELAALLNGREYRNEITKELRDQAKESGLVVVYGASDDLIEFDGAIRDEFACYGGGTVFLNEFGALVNECESEECPYFEREQKKCKMIRATWHEENNFSYDDAQAYWEYRTDIPHATFNIYEDDELYCVGIVFELSALKEPQSIRRWEAGSNPPGGLYIIYKDAKLTDFEAIRVLPDDPNPDITACYYIRFWSGIRKNWRLWGPIPEPEAEK